MVSGGGQDGEAGGGRGGVVLGVGVCASTRQRPCGVPIAGVGVGMCRVGVGGVVGAGHEVVEAVAEARGEGVHFVGGGATSERGRDGGGPRRSRGGDEGRGGG